MFTDDFATPGIVIPVVLIPLALILSVALSILKGFNLLPSKDYWNSALSRLFHGRKTQSPTQNPISQVSRDTIGSFSTIESSFIGQNNEANQVVSKPHIVHYPNRPSQRSADEWYSRPLSCTPPYSQEGQV